MVPAWLSFFDAILAVVLATVGVLGAHYYYMAPFQGFQLFAFGFVLSIIGLTFGLIGIFMTRTPARAAVRPRAKFGTFLSLAVAVPILLLFLSGRKYPAINDITTDFDNPPEFTRAPQFPANQGRDMKYDKQRYAERQAAGYDELAPLKMPSDPDATFAKVEAAAKEVPTWLITVDDPKAHTLEGIATSRLFHFNDDFVIQVRPAADGPGSLVEMRSKSRVGIGDFGVNYKRIKMFFAMLSGDSSASG
jgi:uncharacterized protein (DUF1499 family)